MPWVFDSPLADEDFMRLESPFRGAVLFATALFIHGHPTLANADGDGGGVSIVRIEETWELELADPDASNTAPQVTCTFSPVGHLKSLHATLELNHLATPEFVPGGVHLHAWNGDQMLASRHEGTASLRTAGEVIRWKQVISLTDERLTLAVTDGESTTWGEFGAAGRLQIDVPTTLQNLNSYSPTVSVEQSGVGFAGNRVKRLALVNVKAQTSSGLTVEDPTDRVAHQLE
jgi:hypothetical protein